MSILDYVPKGYTLRDNQEQILTTIEANWANDIQVVLSDVGTGKSLILQTIARWQSAKDVGVATITPRVALQDQYKESFPGIPILKGSTRYRCKSIPDLSCKEKKELWSSYCRGNCHYIEAKKAATSAKNAVFNLQSYLLNDDPREVLLIDEAHTLFDQLSQNYTLRIWKHKYDYPDNLKNYLDILVWIEKTVAGIKQNLNNSLVKLHDMTKNKEDKDSHEFKQLIKDRVAWEADIKKLTSVYTGIQLRERNFFIEHSSEPFRGGMRPMLKIRPTTLAGLPSIFGKNTRKIILATATMSKEDLKKLGLAHKNHVFHSFPTPLDVADRPIVPEFVGNMGFKYREKNLPKLAEKIVELQKRHSNTKGVVHVTYSISKELQELLSDVPNLLWHTPETREKRLTEFLKAEPGTVLMAAGMTTGIDLAGPEYGWQAISKVMYPSQLDALIAEWYQMDKEWILWLAARETIQASGRVNRYRGDKAITYVLDNCFGNPVTGQYGLYQRADKAKLWPEYFKDRIRWRGL